MSVQTDRHKAQVDTCFHGDLWLFFFSPTVWAQRQGKEIAGTHLELTFFSVDMGVWTREGSADKLFTLS